MFTSMNLNVESFDLITLLRLRFQVYSLAIPYRGLESLYNNNRTALIVLIVMAVIMVISVSMFVFLLVGAAKREMYLRAMLIKQMDATQQAERKSMNKSLAFASASHDVRASLAGITGLIDIAKNEVAPFSEIGTNLIQMEGCVKDLLGNSTKHWSITSIFIECFCKFLLFVKLIFLQVCYLLFRYIEFYS